MKKILTLILAVSMVLSLAACGGDDKPSTSTSTPSTSTSAPSTSTSVPSTSTSTPSTSSSSPKTDATADLKNAEFSPAQQEAAQKFSGVIDRYNSVADKVNADPNLADLGEVVDLMNEIQAAMTEADAVFADPKNLTDDVLKQVDVAVVNVNLFLDEVESMLKNYAGKETITVPVEIINNTGADLHTLAMSPANDESWGANLLTEVLADGESGTTEMTFTKDTLVWDLLAGDAEDTTLSFMGLDFTEVPTTGGKLQLSATEGGAYVASFVE